MSSEASTLVEQAIAVVCNEREKDPLGSIPIDDMQGRLSIPVHSPEAVEGARRAQQLLPIARNLTIKSLRELAVEHNFHRTRGYAARIQSAVRRVNAVKWIKPDVDSRDNASVFLDRPQTITFGTIFLVGLPSDEGMISVLSHELMHIADGNHDSLNRLFETLGERASRLTGLEIHDQKAEELACDLVGAMAARAFVASTPDYQPLARRISRAVAHNCVVEDEGDEDHLSPRNTIRALFALKPALARELVSGEEELFVPRRRRR
ncbi:MAG TPA: hypothetical protein VMM84_06960 [Pyrinomonadaceae bacterium]|nr:hypothetical protein [Pyrinomonadaceae bacterium]